MYRSDAKSGKSRQPALDTARRVFLDESGVNTGMTCLYGRAAKHERVIEAVPGTRFFRTTIVSSVRLDGTTIPFVYEGALNGDIFKVYTEKRLVPSLKPGDIRLLAKPQFCSGKNIEKLAGRNSIIEFRKKSIVIMDNLSCHKVNGIVEAIAFALNSVSCSDICGWFRHDGYPLR